MSVRTPLLRLWMLMALVGVAAVALAIPAMTSRATAYRKLAAHHAELEESLRRDERHYTAKADEYAAQKAAFLRDFAANPEAYGMHVRPGEKPVPDRDLLTGFDSDEAYYRDKAAAHAKVGNYHTSMRKRYERASRNPFLSMPPEPPKPTID